MEQESPQDCITFMERALVACVVLAVFVVWLGVCALFSLVRS